MQRRLRLWSATDSSRSQHARLCMSPALSSQVVADRGRITNFKDGKMPPRVSRGKIGAAAWVAVCNCASGGQCYTSCILTTGPTLLSIFTPSASTSSRLPSPAPASHAFASFLHLFFFFAQLSLVFFDPPPFTNAHTCLSVLGGKSRYAWNAGSRKRNAIRCEEPNVWALTGVARSLFSKESHLIPSCRGISEKQVTSCSRLC